MSSVVVALWSNTCTHLVFLFDMRVALLCLLHVARNDGTIENVLVLGGTVPIFYGGVQVIYHNDYV